MRKNVLTTSLAAIAAVAVFAGERTLTLDEYRDKMKGAWVGQMVGVSWGQPTEFKWKDEIIPADKVPAWASDFPLRMAYGNDDLYVEMTFLKTLEDYGLDVSIRQAGIDFANSEYKLWCANRAGRDNLRRGVAPPDCSHPKYNKCPNDIDYQIEADYSGIIAPGCPQEAIRLGGLFGRLMNYGDGVWAGQFIGAMYAEAFFTADVNALIDAGLAAIPAESDYAQMVRNVRKWHRETPGDWTKCWEKIRANYSKGHNKALRDSNGAIDVRLNGACIVLGLLYGEGDLDKSIVLSMRCGWDSDCNPSNVGGILMTARGFKALPAKYVEKLDYARKFSYTAYNLPCLFAVCEKLARQVVVRNGGRVEKGADGAERFVIPVKAPKPDPFVPSWNAPAPTGSRYAEEEMAKQRFVQRRPTPEYLKSAVVYQLVLRNFTRDGNFKAATEMLDHVRSVGVDVVYLSPFVEMDCDMDETGWSPRQIKSGYHTPKNPYRISNYDKIDPEYGHDADFKAFNDKAHALGMKVYMDLVYLHCGPNNVIKDLFPDAFQRNADGSVRMTQWRFPFVNFKSKGVRKYLIDSMLHWMSLGCDGFRCDVGDAVPIDFWVEAVTACQKVKPDLVMINEGSKPEMLEKAFDACYAWPWSFNLRSALTGSEAIAWWLKHQKKTFAERLKSAREYEAKLPSDALLFCFLDNHDTAADDWEMRFDRIRPVEAGNAAFVLTFLRRGLPLVFNGNEIADNSLNTFFAPVEDVARARKTVDWARALQPAGQKRLALVRALAKMRHEDKIFADGSQEWIVDGDDKGIVAFVRRLGDRMVFVAANMTDKDAAFVPSGVSFAHDVRPMFSERFSLGAGGECRFGPWGHVVVPVRPKAAEDVFVPKWKVSKGVVKYVKIEGDRLVVDVPPGVTNVCAYATADIDLSDWAQCVLEAEVRCRGERLVRDARPARGVKLSLHFSDAVAGDRRYPAAPAPDEGSFGWTNLQLGVAFGEVAPLSKPGPQVVLGIQQTSGRVEFDLSSFRLRKAPPLFPMKDNDYKIKYPPSRGRMRGVMGRGVCRNTEQDIEDLKNYGANLIRLQMNGFAWKGKKNRPPVTLADWNAWLKRNLDHAEQVLGWLEARDMQMVLDMHNPPLGGYGHSGDVFYVQENADAFIEAWRMIARRFKGRRGIYGYDLMNEPFQTRRALPDCDYWNIQRRTAEAIRAIDPDATIVFAPNEWSSPRGFEYLSALEMDNVVYELHMYMPGWFTHQGANGSPIPSPEKALPYPNPARGVDKEKLREWLKPVVDFQRRHNARIFVGEFSACIYAPGAGQYLEDCISLFEEYGWDWTYHSFREARWWNVETVLDPVTRKPVPSKDNDRFRALVDGFKGGARSLKGN